VLGLEIGDLFDTATAGLLPSDFWYDADDDGGGGEEDGFSMYGGGGWGGGGASGGGAAGVGAGGAYAGGIGGAVRDSGAAMMFQPRRLRALRRRYDQLLRIALMVQNRTDDIATAFERLRAMVVGVDPLATALFYSRCLMVAGAMLVFGGRRLLFAWWCWEALRPPWMRVPPGVKGPLRFVANLPSRSGDDL
jgi:hypothetical protein